MDARRTLAPETAETSSSPQRGERSLPGVALHPWLRLTLFLFFVLHLLAPEGQASEPQQPAVKPPAPSSPLTLAHTIPLPKVQGRIDHFAYDGKRLFIAALGNNSLEVIDLEKGQRTRSIPGLKEPQGVAYIPSTNSIAVACGGDGTLHLYDAATLEEKKHAQAGDDADNARFDDKSNTLWVGIADGALAAFDPTTLQKKSEIKLKGHPESFQLDPASPKVFVNVPGGFVGGGGMVAVADRDTGKVTQTIELKDAGRNFPMALDSPHKRLYIGCRRPARLLMLDTDTLAVVAKAECVGDADDIYIDRDSNQVLVIGGDGAIDVFESKDATLTRTASIKTESGARTGFFAQDRRALYVAVPVRTGHDAEVREYILAPATEPPKPEEKKP
jgi:YVTN family beta-propeller protein